VQSALMITKLAAIGMLIVVGLLATRATSTRRPRFQTEPVVPPDSARHGPVLKRLRRLANGELRERRDARPAGIAARTLIGVVGVTCIWR
jgi:hypothetical protein